MYNDRDLINKMNLIIKKSIKKINIMGKSILITDDAAFMRMMNKGIKGDSNGYYDGRFKFVGNI